MQILNVGQVYDLANGGFTNQMTVQLKDGRVVVIATDEETVTQLLNAAAAEVRGVPPAGLTVLPSMAEEQPEAAAPAWGGDLPDPGEELAPPVPPATGILAPESPSEPEYPRDKLGRPIKRGPDRRGALGAGHPNKRGRVDPYRTTESVPSRTVPMDEKGNPIVPREHRVENATADAPADDEDGTSI